MPSKFYMEKAKRTFRDRSKHLYLPNEKERFLDKKLLIPSKFVGALTFVDLVFAA